MKTTKRIAICNGKGGVGKTTTTANLGAALARSNKKVLLVDMDPQQSLTDFFMVEIEGDDSITLKDILTNTKFNPTDAIVEIANGLDLLPITEDAAIFADALSKSPSSPFQLKNAISKILETKDYDYVLIDTPPSLSIFVDLCLAAATDVMIPLKANDVDMKATEKFLNTIEAAKEINPELQVNGIVFTMVKKGSKIHDTFANMFEGMDLEAKVCDTKIRDSVKLGASSSKGVDIFSFDPKGIGADDYKKLAQEVLSWN